MVLAVLFSILSIFCLGSCTQQKEDAYMEIPVAEVFSAVSERQNTRELPFIQTPTDTLKVTVTGDYKNVLYATPKNDVIVIDDLPVGAEVTVKLEYFMPGDELPSYIGYSDDIKIKSGENKVNIVMTNAKTDASINVGVHQKPALSVSYTKDSENPVSITEGITVTVPSSATSFVFNAQVSSIDDECTIAWYINSSLIAGYADKKSIAIDALSSDYINCSNTSTASNSIKVLVTYADGTSQDAIFSFKLSAN